MIENLLKIFPWVQIHSKASYQMLVEFHIILYFWVFLKMYSISYKAFEVLTIYWSNSNWSFQIFLEKFVEVLEGCRNSTKPKIVIIGDFLVAFNGDCNEASCLTKLFAEYGFSSLIRSWPSQFEREASPQCNNNKSIITTR